MLTPRLHCRTARPSNRGGFTLVELLVVIGIIAILAGVALGPITRGIKQAQESTSMQTCRQIGLMEFAYSNDNSQVYPYGTSAEIIANLLLNGNYASDPNVFYIASTPNSVKPVAAAGGVYTQVSKFCTFDFMVNTTGLTGVTSTAADSLPICEGTGANSYTPIVVPVAIAGIPLVIDSTKTAFSNDGIPVTYKSNSAVFLKCTATTATTATSIQPIIPASFTDSNAGNYGLEIP